jgi:sterol 14-demethylase
MNFAKNEMAVITALLFQQFDVELLTPNPRVISGMGANHPSAAILRYRRKKVKAEAEVAREVAVVG